MTEENTRVGSRRKRVMLLLSARERTLNHLELKYIPAVGVSKVEPKQ